MRARTLAAALAVALIVGTSLGAFRQDVLLRYRFAAGDSLDYRLTQETSSTVSGLPGGMPDMQIGMNIAQTLRMVAESVAGSGTATLKQTIENVKLDMTSPMMNMSFDSAKPDQTGPGAAEMKKMFSGMIGEPVTVVLTPTGTVEKVEGYVRLAERMFKGVGGGDPGADAMRTAITSMFSDENMKSTLSQGFAALPDRAVKVGDSWNRSLAMKNPAVGEVTTDMTFTLAGLEGAGDAQTAKISMQVRIKQTGPAGEMPMGLKMAMGDASGDGEIEFQVARGRMLRSTTRMAMPMTMSGAMPDGTPADMKTLVKTSAVVELIGK